jgi:hypothetical protein
MRRPAPTTDAKEWVHCKQPVPASESASIFTCRCCGAPSMLGSWSRDMCCPWHRRCLEHLWKHMELSLRNRVEAKTGRSTALELVRACW